MPKESYRRVNSKLDKLCKMQRWQNGFEISRLIVRGTLKVRYALKCRWCGETYFRKLDQQEPLIVDFKCSHPNTRKKQYFTKESLVEGWIQVARKRHIDLLSQNAKQNNVDSDLISFKRFIDFVLDKASLNELKKVDPSSINVSQRTQGLLKENLIFNADPFQVWPDIELIKKSLSNGA